eukprot:6198173-Pleurochrysis_carterae.AAC.1
MQHADCWLQCFVWWGPDGRAGVVVDRRLGFGGAYVPNRFERVSTLVAAHVQAAQAWFDAARPLPKAPRAWADRRREVARQEKWRGGEGQAEPRYLPVYNYRRFTGVALTEAMPEAAELRGVHIDPVHTRAGGGVLWETPVRCTATAVALQACCASARCVLRGFVSETE